MYTNQIEFHEKWKNQLILLMAKYMYPDFDIFRKTWKSKKNNERDVENN